MSLLLFQGLILKAQEGNWDKSTGIICVSGKNPLGGSESFLFRY